MASKYLTLVNKFDREASKIKHQNSNKADYKYFSFTKEQRRKGGGVKKRPPSLKVSTSTRCHCILASCENGTVLQRSSPSHAGVSGADPKSWLMPDPFHTVDIREVGG